MFAKYVKTVELFRSQCVQLYMLGTILIRLHYCRFYKDHIIEMIRNDIIF